MQGHCDASEKLTHELSQHVDVPPCSVPPKQKEAATEEEQPEAKEQEKLEEKLRDAKVRYRQPHMN